MAENSGTELRERIMNCQDSPLPKYKRPPLTELFVPKFSPSSIGAYYSMGENTHKIPMALFAENRRRLSEELRKRIDLPEGAIVLLQGGVTLNFYNTDTNKIFRQESYFHWAFGVQEPDMYGAIVVETGESILYVPRLPEEYATWCGAPRTLCQYKKEFETNQVTYVDQLKFSMRKLRERLGSITILTLFGLNTDSELPTTEAIFEGMEEFPVNNTILFPVISELRVFKTPMEIELIKYTNRISSEAHKQVMRKIKPGMYEYQCEAIFREYSYYVGGCRFTSYPCICASGENASVLHYGHAGAPNDKLMKDGDICCFDMGACYYGYTSDITCSFPVNGKFTDDQKLIYNAVLAARNIVLEKAKPGVSWCDMHLEANRTLLECLRDGGLLQGDVNEMITAGLGAVFLPHGLGHLLGCDVHDVGGYLEGNPERPLAPGFKNLRTARILQPGMVLTVEPGCYFIPWLLEKASSCHKQSKFLVHDVIKRFRKFGGVRIEDNVLVTEDGVLNMTLVPRTIEEVEKWMAGTDYDKAVDGLLKAHDNIKLTKQGSS